MYITYELVGALEVLMELVGPALWGIFRYFFSVLSKIR